MLPSKPTTSQYRTSELERTNVYDRVWWAMTCLLSFVPAPYEGHEIVQSVSDTLVVRPADDRVLRTLGGSDDPSHVLKFEVTYMSREQLLSPRVVSVVYYLPVGDVTDERRSVEVLYEALRNACLPVDVMNHEPSIGPRYTETGQQGEAVATVNADPTASKVWPITRLRTTPVAAVHLTVRRHPDYDEHTRVFEHYDNELTQRTGGRSLSSIRLQDQDSGALFSLTTDGDHPSIAFPENMDPNRLSVC